MKHFKNPETGELFAFEADGSQDEWINPELVPITDEEADAIRAAMVSSAPSVVPTEVSRFQGRAGLIVYGQQIGRPRLLHEADAFVAGLTAGQFGLTVVEVELIREAWATAQVFRRDSPFLNLLFPGLGLQLPEQLDALFVVAAQQVA